MNQPKIAWIIPCHNEEAAISIVIHDIKKHCPNSSIYVFDNCSTDSTSKVAADAGAIVIQELRKGKGYVVNAMFEKIEADIYLMVDGDATYEIAAWQSLVEPIIQGRADMTVATRLQKYSSKSFRRFHVFGNNLIKGLINFIYDAQLNDVLSGYRAFSRQFVKSIPLGAKGFEVETELTINALEHRFSLVEVPCDYFDRAEGTVSKLNTFQDGAIIIFTILRLVKDHKPLTVFGTLSAVALMLAVAFQYFASADLAVIIFFGVSITSLFTGIILTTISQRIKELAQVMRKNA